MTYYVEIARTGQPPERWRCNEVERVPGALFMTGDVELMPASGYGPADSVVIPFGGFELARIECRGDRS